MTRHTLAGSLLATIALALAAGPASANDDTPSCAGGYAERFVLGGAVTHREIFTAQRLQEHASAKQNIAYFSGQQGLVQKSYIGVPLIDLLNEAVVVTDPTRKNDILRKYVVVRATDCYEVVLSLAELLPTFGGQQVTIAFATGDGQPLPANEGMARLVVPGDKAGGRYVSNVVRIEVRSAPSR